MALLIPSPIPGRWTEIYESAKALLEAIGLIIRQEPKCQFIRQDDRSGQRFKASVAQAVLLSV
jgi:hypothetical protein